MADVTLSYKGSDILELSDSGSATLKTGGKYCEDDIAVEYVKPEGGEPSPMLPSGYTKVNCVSIPMGGYVNTLIVPTYRTSKYFLDARLDTPVSSITTSATLFGSKTGPDGISQIAVFNSYTGFTFQFLTSTYKNIKTKDNYRHSFYSDLMMIVNSVDDTIVLDEDQQYVKQSASSPILIGARQTADGTGLERNAAMTVWRYTHTKDGVVACDLIPCKNQNNEYGFYDLVSESFFGNLGTGTFTEGVE